MIKMVIMIRQPADEQLKVTMDSEDEMDATRLEVLFATLLRAVVAQTIEDVRNDDLH